MYFGKIVEMADSDELFKNPIHPYTKSLLSVIPLSDPIYEKTRVRTVYNPNAKDSGYGKDTELTQVAPGHFVRMTVKK